MMKIQSLRFGLLIAGLWLGSVSSSAQTMKPDIESALIRISDEIMENGKAYDDLAELLANGHRLTGSENAQKAVDWSKKKMESYGFDRVYLQPVMVPKWERGTVSKATVTVNGKKENLHIVALGKSVGTPAGGISAEVIEVKQLSELDALGNKVKGKIVFFSRPFDEKLINTFAAYSGAVDQRSAGPSRASKYGAVATIVRSMTNRIDNHPHTGTLTYVDSLTKIPAAAVTTADAERLSRWLKENKNLTVQLDMNCKNFPDVQSYNVIGEIKGSEFPDEILVIGGHLDSWDLSPGAHDDASGCVQSIEALRAYKALGLKPKRTIRAVMYMSEEVGGIGGEEYAKQAKILNEKHIGAIESDRGGFSPRGITVKASDSVFTYVSAWKKYFTRLNADDISKGYGGVDIDPLGKQGTALFGLYPDPQRYFDYHHSDNDDLSAVNPRELKLGAVVMAQFMYLISELGVQP